MKKKWELIAWQGKSEDEGIKFGPANELIFPTCFKNKGDSYDWPIEDWPPRKVKITLEYLE